MKKVLSFFAGFLVLIAPVSGALAQETNTTEENKVPVEVFVRSGCVHCEDEKDFLVELDLKRDDFKVHFHNIDEPIHYEHWKQLAELEGIQKATPITLIGKTIIQGFDSSKTTGKRIEDLIDYYKDQGEYLTFEEFIASGGSANIEESGGTCDDTGDICELPPAETSLITVPFFGVIDTATYSLPTLSIILGFIDGFNPCAMWVLITFLVVLAQAGSRKKMWQIAGLFIVAEAIMYWLILNVWFTAWDFVKLDNIVTPVVGLIAVGGGIFFLWEWKSSDGTCKVTNPKQRSRTSKKISDLVNAELTIATALGIIALAFSVNIIELACSVGIVPAFTKTLEINQLTFLEQQFYMGLYILFYMVDDFIVFGIALYGIEKLGITTKYTKVSHFVGGILMVILGLLLIFNPDALIF